MLGGVVLQVAQATFGSRKTWQLQIVDTRLARVAPGLNDECYAYIEDTGEGLPNPGDWVWWQQSRLLWTPKDESFQNKPLKFLGYESINIDA